MLPPQTLPKHDHLQRRGTPGATRTHFLFLKEKELFTGEGCVEMDNPWQLCRTIGPLTLHRQEM